LHDALPILTASTGASTSASVRGVVYATQPSSQYDASVKIEMSAGCRCAATKRSVSASYANSRSPVLVSTRMALPPDTASAQTDLASQWPAAPRQRRRDQPAAPVEDAQERCCEVRHDDACPVREQARMPDVAQHTVALTGVGARHDGRGREERR